MHCPLTSSPVLQLHFIGSYVDRGVIERAFLHSTHAVLLFGLVHPESGLQAGSQEFFIIY